MATSIPYPEKKRESTSFPKYSTFPGVYVPALLTMFGAILFLRMGWIVGAVGLFQSVLIITITSIITLITAVSISSIASNSSSNSGGAYYMISNELGIGLGSAIGIPLYLAQTFTVCFCIFGFIESLSSFFPLMPVQPVGALSLVVLAFIAYTSLDLTIKLQMAIFLILVASLAAFFFGHPYSKSIAAPIGEFHLESFWSVFSLFFPIAMGVECGISMSQNLKTPSKSILIGSVAAVLTAFLVYIAVAGVLSKYAPLEVLQSDPLVMHKCSKYQGIIHLSVWSLAMVSAIGSLLSAPRTLQALAMDGIIFNSIGVEYGEKKEPRIAIAITLIIAFICIYLGDLNMIAPILTMVLLAAYGFINLATGFEEMMENPSWRPSFRMPWGIPIFGAILSFIAMFMIDALTTFIVIVFFLIGYSLVKLSGTGSKKDDLRQSLLFFLSRNIIYQLADESLGSRSWRPNFLVFTRSPTRFTNILLFARELTRKHGFLTVASVFSVDQALRQKEKEWSNLIRKSLRAHRTRALVEVVSAKTPAIGMKQIIETYGIGPLVPNTIIVGQNLAGEEISTYTDIIEFAIAQQRNILIFRDYLSGETQLPKEIDIWWDEDLKQSAKFMLVLAFMLKRSPLFRRANFTLKSIVTSENARTEREHYFRKLLDESRIDIQSKVFLGTSMMQYANKDGLTFIGMRAKDSEESLEDYENYYKQQMVATKDLSMVIFTLSFEQISLHTL